MRGEGCTCSEMFGLMQVQGTIELGAWLVAAGWVWRTASAARGLPRIADLRMAVHDVPPEGRPSVTVIVPARDEGPHVRACLESLLAQDYPVQVIAVDDRSTDETAAVMDGLAEQHPGRLTVLHVTELPAGWLGKTHALALAAGHAAAVSQPEYLLFTDADVVFRADALRRAVGEAQRTGADHLVLMPTALARRWDEAMMLGAFQALGMWALRPWRVADPRALRDAIGVGAFNLMRREAYERLGGFETQRMDILEDLTLARRVKQAGMRQRIAFGKGLVSVHWAAGASGILGVMTKNLFAVFRFHLSLVLVACGWLMVFCIAPVFGLLYGPTRVPAVLVLLSVVWAFWLYGKHSGVRTWNAVLFPVGALLFVFGILRSTAITLAQGGVLWRGTFYPLAELRRLSAPLWGRKA